MTNEEKAENTRRVVFAQWLRWVDAVIMRHSRGITGASRSELVGALNELRRIEKFYAQDFDAALEGDAQASVFEALNSIKRLGLDAIAIEAGLTAR